MTFWQWIKGSNDPNATFGQSVRRTLKSSDRWSRALNTIGMLALLGAAITQIQMLGCSTAGCGFVRYIQNGTVYEITLNQICISSLSSSNTTCTGIRQGGEVLKDTPTVVHMVLPTFVLSFVTALIALVPACTSIFMGGGGKLMLVNTASCAASFLFSILCILASGMVVRKWRDDVDAKVVAEPHGVWFGKLATVLGFYTAAVLAYVYATRVWALKGFEKRTPLTYGLGSE